MNTTVKYKRPSHLNKYGEYKSITNINQNDIVGHIEISLVWFNSLGWYSAINLIGWKRLKNDLNSIVYNFAQSKKMWRHGKELSLCAEAAEAEAKEICNRYGITELEFAPYILPRQPRKLIRK